MGINSHYFEETIKIYREKIKKEKNSKLNRKFEIVKNSYKSALKINDYRNVNLYAFMHEIKTYFLLKEKFNNVTIGNAENGEFDFDVDDFIAECTTITSGDNPNIQELKFGFYDYPKNDFASRIVNAFKNKRQQYYKRTSKDPSLFEKPFVLFIGSGMLTDQIIENVRQSDTILLSLYGIGCPKLFINTQTIKFVDISYQEEEKIKTSHKRNFQVNLFNDPKYNFISAVCLCLSGFGGEYNNENICIYKNPNATVNLNTNIFEDITFSGEINYNFN